MCIKATLGSLELYILHMGAHQIICDPALVSVKGNSEPFEVTALRKSAELIVTTEEGDVVAILVVDVLSQLRQIKLWDPSHEFYLYERSSAFEKLLDRYSR